MTRKNWIMSILFILAVCSVCTGLISALLLHECKQAVYEYISGFSQLLVEDYPESEEIVLSTLKKYVTYAEQDIKSSELLNRYGYTGTYFSESMQQKLMLILIVTILLSGVCFCLVFICFGKRNRSRIDELTDYLEQVNTGKFGTVIQTENDEFSQLQDEIYKAVTYLYQTKDAAIKAKENFAENLANIAHQLKTPLTAAGISIQLMKEESPSVYAEQIQKQLERLTKLEEALLTLSQIDAGVLKPGRSPVDIFTALSLAAENLNDFLIQKNVTLDIPENGCIEICGDLEWTMQAFMNIMKNCLEHSKEGGMIHCNYNTNPLYTEILIWDEGEGFEKEDIPHLFERFYRGKRAVGNGIGLGLSFAHSIFEMQNGNITARNLQEGGACFEIRVYSH